MTFSCNKKMKNSWDQLGNPGLPHPNTKYINPLSKLYEHIFLHTQENGKYTMKNS